MMENPLAWKMLNIEKSFASFVDKVFQENSENSSFKKNLKNYNEQ